MKHFPIIVLLFGLSAACANPNVTGVPTTDAPTTSSLATAPAPKTAGFLQLRLVAEQGGVEFPSKVGPSLRLENEVVVGLQDIASAVVEGSTVNLTLRPESAAAFGDATGKNINRRLAIVVDGSVVSSPVIKAKIDGGHFQVPVASPEEAKQLAGRISGK